MYQVHVYQGEMLLNVSEPILIMRVLKFLSTHASSLFSRQIAIGNAGPILALESMGAKQTFRCHSVNIGLMYKQ